MACRQDWNLGGQRRWARAAEVRGDKSVARAVEMGTAGDTGMSRRPPWLSPAEVDSGGSHRDRDDRQRGDVRTGCVGGGWTEGGAAR